MSAPRKLLVLIALAIVALAGCDEKKEQLRSATTPADAGAPTATTPAPSASPSAPPTASAVPDAADVKRFDPKHKCPTGQTHFFLEGDFCRRRCFTNADCGKKERCSPIEYPYIVDGGPAGTGKFCEGT